MANPMRPDDLADPFREPRIGRVTASKRLTPHMQRVTIAAECWADMPERRNGAHIRITLPAHGQGQAEFAEQLSSPWEGSLSRTYSVRQHRPDLGEVDIDFVLHGEKGFAANWARTAARGDAIGFGRPGSRKIAGISGDWYLLAADMSAIPAACAALEDLPRDAVGTAVFEIAGPDDRQPVEAPPGIEIQWIVTPDRHAASARQLAALREMTWRSGDPAVFVAGESGAMKALRQFLTVEKGLDRRAMYLSAYWTLGLSEGYHRWLKRIERARARFASGSPDWRATLTG
jgi:NADPH-dependent ferric siderophore reductase